MAKKRKTKNKIKGIVVIGTLLIIVGLCTYLTMNDNDKKNSLFDKDDNPETETNTPVEVKKLKIVDPESKTRPFAIMINNHPQAWPQAGLQEAYMVYEMIVEGGITRMLALYKDAATASIGSVRSARHYFLDYAAENDAIYVHFGWSPQAESDIKSRRINNINGMIDAAGFWRDSTLKRPYEHTVFTSIDKLKTLADKKGYAKNTDKDLLLNYSIDEININDKDGSKQAHNISITYSSSHTTKYTYNEAEGVYYRVMRDIKNVDLINGKQYTTKNIIVISVENYALDSSGRQELRNTGTGDGYYITNGHAVPIKWKKDTHSSQTIYTYLDGKEITVNDGNTYIQIQPKGQSLKID